MKEILDILFGFAKCSSERQRGIHAEVSGQEGTMEEWVIQLRELMKADLATYEELARSQNESVQDFATWIVECLSAPDPY